MKWSRRKRVLWITGACIGAVMLCLLAFPVWCPWVLRPVGQRNGLHFSRYERVGYSRFAVNDVAYTNGTTTFHAGRVEGYVPTVWLWRHFVRPGTGDDLHAEGWQLNIQQLTSGRAGESASVYEEFHQIRSIIAEVQNWIPRATLSNGTLIIRRQVIHLPSSWWAGRVLMSQVAATNILPAATVRAYLPEQLPYEMQVEAPALDLNLAASIAADATGLTTWATNVWLTNRIVATARFGREGLLPLSAQLDANSVTIPGRFLGSNGLQTLNGTMALVWQTNRYVIDVSANAPPVATNLPAVAVELQVTGDLDGATIERGKISVPWARAELTPPTRVKFASPFLAEDVRLKLFVELGGQNWFPAQGTLSGEAILRPGPGSMPPVFFDVSGARLRVSGVEAESLKAQATMAWPWLELTNARVTLTENSVAVVSGKMNLKTRDISDARLKFEGRLGAQWLPAGVSYEHATLTAKADGPWHKLAHAGSVKLERVTVPHLAALEEVSTDWKGENLNLERMRIAMKAREASLWLEGAGRFGAEEENLILHTLTLKRGSEDQLALGKPLQVLFQRTPSTQRWDLKIDSLDWRGDGGQLYLQGALRWPTEGQLRGHIRELKSRLFAGIVDLPAKDWGIGEIEFSAGWTNGPVHWDLQFDRMVKQADGATFSAAGRAKADANEVTLEKVSVWKEKDLIASAHGHLPLALQPAGTNFLERRASGKLQIDMTVNPEVSLWSQLAEAHGLLLQGPALDAHVTGTWAAPLGRIQFRAREVKLKRVQAEMPPMENMAVDLVVAPDSLRLEGLRFSVANQPVSASGQMPLPDDFWKGLPKKTELPDWRKATAQLQIDHAQVIALTPFLSDMLAPEGTLKADVSLKPGGDLNGQLIIEGVNTRPFEGIGAIHDIQVTCRLNGERIELDSRASIGGQLALAKGSFDLSRERWRKGDRSLPPFEIRLRGSNVPLTRRAEAIVRADLNVAITNAPRRPPVIFGDVHLRNSFYLQDLADLVPAGVTTARRRPPYFSIDREPFADWRLNISVTGDEFLKVRSPLFRGRASANLELTGTLQNPVASGEIRVPSGTVRMPFASMPITQGFVTLSSDNPYQPQLFITAAERVFGYDVKMEITGPAHQPVIQFSSNPPLSSEQIILMVMAGEIPRSDLTLTGEQRAQGMALYLGKSVLYELGFLSGDANRLTFRSGEQISEAGKPTYSLEYKLSDDWGIIGEYDRFNDYNLMLKWRVYPW